MVFSSPYKSFQESFNSDTDIEASPPASQRSFDSPPSSQPQRERLGRRLFDSRPVVDRAGSLYTSQGSSPITGLFGGQTSTDSVTSLQQEHEEADNIEPVDLFTSSDEATEELPYSDVEAQVADCEERLEYWESMARNERPESGPPGSDRNEHALNMVTLYRSRLEQARANLHLAPTHAERRLHLLRSAHEFTSTPSDLVNIAGAIRAYESGLITSTETQQVIFFNGRIIDRIPPGAPLDYTERMEQYTNLDPTGSIWVEPPSTTPRPLACSAITLENSTDTMNSIHVEANITEGSHWYMDQTLQLCWPGGKPFFTSSKTKYPSTRPPHPDLELPFNRKQVSGPVTFSFLVDSGATDILIFEEDLSSMGFKQGVTPMMSMTSVLTATATVKMPRYACFVSYPGTDMVRESSFFVIKRAQKDSSRLSGLGVWRDFSTFTAPLATKKGNTTVFYGEDSTHGMIATMNRAFGKKGHMLVKPQEKERVTAPPPKPLGKKKVEEKKEMKKEGNSIARWIFEKKALRKAGPKLPPKGTNMEDDVFSFDETRVQRTTDYVPINKGRKLLQSTKYSTPLRKILAAGAVEARTRGGLRRKGEGRPNKVVKKAAKKASKKAETEKAGRFPFYDDVVGKDGTIL